MVFIWLYDVCWGFFSNESYKITVYFIYQIRIVFDWAPLKRRTKPRMRWNFKNNNNLPLCCSFF